MPAAGLACIFVVRVYCAFYLRQLGNDHPIQYNGNAITFQRAAHFALESDMFEPNSRIIGIQLSARKAMRETVCENDIIHGFEYCIWDDVCARSHSSNTPSFDIFIHII